MLSRARQKKSQVTLARALSKLGVASRSEAENWIRERRVPVDGKLIPLPEEWVDIKTNRIMIDDKPVRIRKKLYCAFHKPFGVVTTRSDEKGGRTVYEFSPPGFSNVFPIGRLDKETRGLLLLTNDTRFGERVSNPESGVHETYTVSVDKAKLRFVR